MRKLASDFVAAFADGGILFPLLVLLAFQGTFSAPILFATAGLAYLVSGFIFKIPMSVQPLKAIAIASVAMGATGLEIRVSAFLLALVCLALTFIDVDRLAKKVPASMIHSVQLGLGVTLVYQGVMALSHSNLPRIGVAIALLCAIWYFASSAALGLLALLGLIAGLIFPSILTSTLPEVLPSIMPATSAHFTQAATDAFTISGLRVAILLSLVLPQLALTLTNSVLATVDVAHRYYGNRANRVTERRLLLSIGFGNIVTSLVGGLPYCHGSGGLTAHYRSGGRTQITDYVMGVTLLILALLAWISHNPVALGYPDFLLAALLASVGIFHFALARPTWSQSPQRKLQLIAAAAVAWFTHNMLYVLLVAGLTEFLLTGLRLKANVTSASANISQSIEVRS